MPGNPLDTRRILIADDQRDVVTALARLLRMEGFETVAARSPVELWLAFEAEPFDAVLLDMNFSRGSTTGQEGLELVAKLKEASPHTPVIVMTAWASIDLAIEAVRRGAGDFLQKPWDNRRLLATLRTQLELGRALASERRLSAANRLLGSRARVSLVARSPAMQSIVELIERVGPSDAGVLISGEHGTGKGVVARELHARSRRATRPLLTVHVGALPVGLFESELFGHVAGAFTDAREPREGRFELADGATLFLDEIGTLPLGLQAKLLRAIESGEFEPVGSSKTRRVDVRLLAATNADLDAQVRAGAFREDLYYRLNTVEIHVPPLRERPDDVIPLAEHFLASHAARYRRAGLELADSAMAALCGYHWPGNVRQMEHCIERAVLLARGASVTADDLGLTDRRTSPGALDDMTLEEVEEVLIRKALARSGGKVAEAATSLGLSRSALYRRLVKHDLTKETSGVGFRST
jgi:DNA-binding NtrC family response regulator